ncbi:hypothetical protein [Rhizobium sp. BR 315]|uniref:hypothetical protein n=1 Tax=Rhizobium sp. BR 315 TaxID=3040014 RepID=UPI003D346A5C
MASLFFGLGSAVSPAAGTGSSRAETGHSRRSDLAILAFFAFIAALWQYQVLGPAPFVVPSGDGGNVGSMVAASLHPDRFINDPVFSESSNTDFYVTITRPWVFLSAVLSGDIGQAYMLMQFPILLLQMTGFFWLGRRLFGGTFWPFVLALVSVPPVFIFNGDLWGNLPAPLTRTVYGAVFPYLILAALPPISWWRPFLVMGLCGLAVYVHPVSAPSVAMALWLAMLAVPQAVGGPARRLLVMVLAGLLFVALAVPFALIFVPSMIQIASPQVSQLQETSKAILGAQYYDVWVALDAALKGGGQNPSPVWGWFYLPWAAALLFILGVVKPLPWRQSRTFFLVLFAGILLSSAGIAWLDQLIARLRGSEPVQLDLIRNLRFVLPALLIGVVWLLAELQERFGKNRAFRLALTAPGVVLVASWWLTFPNPVLTAPEIWRARESSGALRDQQDFRALILRLREAPAGSVVLPLPTEAFETDALAVRYGAFQPLLYLRRDLNFLLYSASRNLELWASLKQQLTGLEQQDQASIESVIRDLRSKHGLRYLLVDSRMETEALAAASKALAAEIVVSGRWRLYRLEDLKE